MGNKKGITYRDAGVDINWGNQLIRDLNKEIELEYLTKRLIEKYGRDRWPYVFIGHWLLSRLPISRLDKILQPRLLSMYKKIIKKREPKIAYNGKP